MGDNKKNSKIKQQENAFSLETKTQVIKKLDTSKDQSQTGAALNLATSTIRTILKNKERFCPRQLQLRQALQLGLPVLQIIQ